MRRLSLVCLFFLFAAACDSKGTDASADRATASEPAAAARPAAPSEDDFADEEELEEETEDVACKITLTYYEHDEEAESRDEMWVKKKVPVMRIAPDYEARFFEAYSEGTVAAPPPTPRYVEEHEQDPDADPRIHYRYNDAGMPVEIVVDPSAQKNDYTYNYQFNCDQKKFPRSKWPKYLTPTR